MRLHKTQFENDTNHTLLQKENGEWYVTNIATKCVSLPRPPSSSSLSGSQLESQLGCMDNKNEKAMSVHDGKSFSTAIFANKARAPNERLFLSKMCKYN